jgi:transcriptional regulator with XRE-family HTH domain
MPATFNLTDSNFWHVTMSVFKTSEWQNGSMSTYPRQLARELLGRRLKEARQAAGLNQAQAAEVTDISEAKLSKLERALNNAVKLGDIFACAHAYGLSPEQTSHLTELGKNANSPSWFQPYDVPQQFATFLELEEAAKRIEIFQEVYVDGLFQQEQYVAALRQMRPGAKGGPDEGLRVDRQAAVLGRPDPPTIMYLTGEAALRQQVGGPKVMRDQVDHLVSMAEQDHIDIFVIPFEAGAHPLMDGACRLMYFDEEYPPTVYLESLHGRRYENDEAHFQRFAEAIRRTQQPSLAVPIKEFIDGNYTLA